MADLRHAVALIAVSMGDPAGIGPEVILKAAAQLRHERRAPALLVIGDLRAMTAAARGLRGAPEPYRWEPGDGALARARGIAVAPASELTAAQTRPGRPTAAGAGASYDYVVRGARMALRGEAAALVTAPISKQWWDRAGHHYPGHSELLARFAHTRLWRMMFTGGELKLALVTVHMGLARVSAALDSRRVRDTIGLLDAHMRSCEGVRKPRIAVLGFNPHAGEGGLFGDEEARAIAPAIASARRAGIDAFGPLAPDTAFIRRAGRFGFDAAVAMYHDQGLIPLKTLEFDRAVNVTLGLPFIRTSPDHGTAFELAGRGAADHSSMLAAIRYAWKMAQARARRRGAA
jgi:4-hydroxythreonine-4-phosphate dehydrogenase